MMNRLWAPWRARYILGPKEKDCLLCRISREDKDQQNLVLWRGELSYMMLNRYPYNTGHLMIVPHHHEKDLESITSEGLVDLMRLTQLGIRVLKRSMKPQGFNLGMNLGDIAGAGVEHHAHLHIVPRWKGDTNFMPVSAATKVISQSLEETHATLKKAFDDLSSQA